MRRSPRGICGGAWNSQATKVTAPVPFVAVRPSETAPRRRTLAIQQQTTETICASRSRRLSKAFKPFKQIATLRTSNLLAIRVQS